MGAACYVWCRTMTERVHTGGMTDMTVLDGLYLDERTGKTIPIYTPYFISSFSFRHLYI